MTEENVYTTHTNFTENKLHLDENSGLREKDFHKGTYCDAGWEKRHKSQSLTTEDVPTTLCLVSLCHLMCWKKNNLKDLSMKNLHCQGVKSKNHAVRSTTIKSKLACN